MKLETAVGIITLLALLGVLVGIIGSFYSLYRRKYRRVLLFIAVGFAMMTPLGIFLLPVLLPTKSVERPAEEIQTTNPSITAVSCIRDGWNHCKDI